MSEQLELRRAYILAALTSQGLFLELSLAQVEEVLRLYQEQYFDFNVRHFHEKLVEEHAIKLSYTWVKQALQGARFITGLRTSCISRQYKF